MSRQQRKNTAILITTNQSDRDVKIRDRTSLLAAALGVSISEIGRAALQAAAANPELIRPFVQSRSRGPSADV
jgi:hypothetical protein